MCIFTHTQDEIKEVFKQYGEIEEIFIMKDKPTGESKGCAFVKFEDHEMAAAAIKAIHQQHTMGDSTTALIVRKHICIRIYIDMFSLAQYGDI